MEKMEDKKFLVFNIHMDYEDDDAYPNSKLSTFYLFDKKEDADSFLESKQGHGYDIRKIGSLSTYNMEIHNFLYNINRLLKRFRFFIRHREQFRKNVIQKYERRLRSIERSIKSNKEEIDSLMNIPLQISEYKKNIIELQERKKGIEDKLGRFKHFKEVQ